MKQAVLSLITITYLLTSCGGSSNSENVTKTPEELKMELVTQEQLEPLTYLTVNAKMKEDQIKTRDAGLFHKSEYNADGNTIYGTIKNSATIAQFKDVVVTVTFYSQTETVIETKDYVFYELYAPNSTTNFELKIYPPEAMAEFGIELKNATVVD